MKEIRGYVDLDGEIHKFDLTWDQYMKREGVESRVISLAGHDIGEWQAMAVSLHVPEFGLRPMNNGDAEMIAKAGEIDRVVNAMCGRQVA